MNGEELVTYRWLGLESAEQIPEVCEFDQAGHLMYATLLVDH